MEKSEVLTAHKRAVRTFDRNSKMAQHVSHVYEHDHSMDLENIAIVNKERNYSKNPRVINQSINQTLFREGDT